MRLQQVHDDLLVRIMGMCDQPTKTSAMLACKALCTASMGVGAWTDVTFKDLDVTAVEFMKRHKCPTVRIRSDCPDDVAWFFDRLKREQVLCMQHVHVDFGFVQRLPVDLLDGLAQHAPLCTLTVAVEDVTDTSEVAFPSDTHLPHLTHLTITERDSAEVVVWFGDARFPSLRCLDLHVSLSDVMGAVTRMPSLRTVRYLYDEEDSGETMEDARLAGLHLDSLELTVGPDTSFVDLWRELATCSVKRLVLHVMDDWVDLTRPLSLELEDITFVMHETHGDVRVDFIFLKELKRMRRICIRYHHWIANDPEVHTQHTLVFAHATLPGVMDLTRTLTLDLPPTACITISP